MGRSRKIQNERVGRLGGQNRTPRAYTLCPKIRKTPEGRFYQEFFQVLTHLETKRGQCLSKSPDFLFDWGMINYQEKLKTYENPSVYVCDGLRDNGHT